MEPASDSPEPSSTDRSRWRRRLVRVSVCLALSLVVLALAWPLLRDLPRRWVVEVLSDALEAEVELEALHLEASGPWRFDGWRLEGLKIHRPGVLPPVDRVEVEILDVGAGLGELLERHVRRLELEGASVRLIPAPWPTSTESSPLRYDHLDPGEMQVTVAAASTEATFRIRGELHDTGKGPLGKLAIDADELPLAPLLAFASTLGGREDVPPSDVELAGLQGSIELESEVRRFELRPEHSGLEQARLLVELEPPPEGGSTTDDSLLAALRTVSAEWRGLELEELLPLVDSRLGRLRGISRGAVALDDSALALEVELSEVRGQVQTSGGLVEIPPELFPLALGIDGARPTSSASLAGQGRLDSPLGGVDFAGRLTVAASGSAPPGEGETRIELEWQADEAVLEAWLPRLADLGLELPAGLAETLRGRLGAKGRVGGLLARPQVEATLELAELEARLAAESSVESVTGKIGLAWSPEAPLVVDPVELTGQLLSTGLTPRPFELGARAELVVASPSSEEAFFERADLGEAILELPGARLSARGSIALSPLPDLRTASGEVRLEAVELATWAGALDPVPPQLEDYSLSGGAELVLTLEPSTRGPRLEGPLELKRLGFASSDGARVLEGFGLRLEVVVENLLPATSDDGWQVTASGRGEGFQLLVDAFFADFSTFTPGIELVIESGVGGEPPRLAGSLRPLPETSHETTLAWRLPRLDLGLLSGVGSGAGPGSTNGDAGRGLPWELELELGDLATLHRELLLPAFGAETVGETVEGALRGRFAGDVRDAEHWRIAGELMAEGIGLAIAGADPETEGYRLEGLEARLPLAIERRGDRVEGPRQAGRLALAGAVGGGLELPALETALWIEGDAMGLEDSLSVPLYGGRIVLERLTFGDLLGAEPSLVAGLRLEGLQLAEISREHELLPLEGTLEGTLPRLRLAGREMVVDGGGEVRVFGGLVRIHGIRGSDVLSPFPRLALSAELENIDLGSLTRKIDFGEMTGVLEGEVRDCELFRGIPVTCQAHFETVRRPGVPRTVDVKAVNNLTILGTGQGNLFDRGVRRLFKRFTYEKMVLGFDLANDALLLSGQPTEDGRELFLSGRLPFPIQVVNAQPGRRVSFQAMRRRIENLDFASATTEP